MSDNPVRRSNQFLRGGQRSGHSRPAPPGQKRGAYLPGMPRPRLAYKPDGKENEITT